MNLLLWGWEAWSLLTTSIITGQTRRLPHSKCPKNTLHINVSSQEGTNNKQSSRKQFYNIPCVKNMIAARLLSFIGKAVQDPHPLQPTKLMLTTCCNNSRKRGRHTLQIKTPLSTVLYYYLNVSLK
jgi:hypothetical protein